MFLSTLPHEVVCKHFVYFLGTANSANYWSGPYPSYVWFPVKDFVPNLILTDVVLERSLEENSCSESFYKTGEVINEGFTS